MDESAETILIVTGAPTGENIPVPATLSGNRVAIQAVKNSLNRFLGGFSEIIESVRRNTEGISVEEMEVNLSVEADGSVGILGTGGSMGATCSITLKINLRDKGRTTEADRGPVRS